MMEFRMMFSLSAFLAMMISTTRVQLASGDELNLRPIIGILTQELYGEMKTKLAGQSVTSHIASSMVKFIESGGSRVIPIFVNQDQAYYETIVKSINGIVLPGGSVDEYASTAYVRAGRVLYDLVIEAAKTGMKIPVVGIGHGFQVVIRLNADSNINPFIECEGSDRADRLIFQSDIRESHLFGNAPAYVIETLKSTKSTSNFHDLCITKEKFKAVGLTDNYKILSTSFDGAGLEYISTIEHKDLPIYGIQFRPENNQFEWMYDSIPHSGGAVSVSRYFSKFFVDKARLNHQQFSDAIDEYKFLIDNYENTYTRSSQTSYPMKFYIF